MENSKSRIDELVAKLHAHGGRMTPQRMAILKVLLAGDHPTVEEVYEVVKRDFPMTSLTTVYRTITLLKQAGEVVEVDVGAPVAHYDSARSYPHPHLVCTVCGRVMDTPDLDVGALIKDLGRRVGDWSLSQEIHFRGICPVCRARQAPDG